MSPFPPVVEAILATLAIGACSVLSGELPSTPVRAGLSGPQVSADAQTAQVLRVIDGDTIEVSIDGRPQTVRYIGVDTPETKHPTKGEQPYGREATERNAELVEGKTVQLEKDVSERDRFDRLLRYVHVGDVMVNAALVADGYARASTFPPDTKYEDLFHRLEQEARERGVGLWGLEAPVEDDNKRDEGGSCDPAYPDVCIPSPPPDLDCGGITFTNFRVLQPDPHRFDGDKDGVGCES